MNFQRMLYVSLSATHSKGKKPKHRYSDSEQREYEDIIYIAFLDEFNYLFHSRPPLQSDSLGLQTAYLGYLYGGIMLYELCECFYFLCSSRIKGCVDVLSSWVASRLYHCAFALVDLIWVVRIAAKLFEK